MVRSEEESFGRTLERGIALFNASLSAGASSVPGSVAFELYDTYGFPLDMTQLLASERGLSVDTAAFELLMNEQRDRGRAAQRREILVAATEGDTSDLKPTEFLGYTQTHAKARLLELVRSGADTFLVFDKTPFYAEMGGQAGDAGGALIGGRLFGIADCVMDKAGRHLHRLQAALEGAAPEAGAEAELSVDAVRRRAISRHHSATHLLHWALRKTLGTHVRQAGTSKTPERLRFDFVPE